jgi:hypothetical protein
MKDSYDFSKGKRGAVTKAAPGKEKITIGLDSDADEPSSPRAY